VENMMDWTWPFRRTQPKRYYYLCVWYNGHWLVHDMGSLKQCMATQDKMTEETAILPDRGVNEGVS